MVSDTDIPEARPIREQAPTCPWWSEELLRDALRHSESVAQLARKWTTTEETLHRWIKRFETDPEAL